MRNTDLRRGLTLIELMVCTVIIGILAGTALPLSRNFVRSKKEEALKERLRELRLAIDRYHDVMLKRNPTAPQDALYPVCLEDLTQARVLRRIPVDPFLGRPEWGTRSTTDEAESLFTDGRNIFDVRSLATGTAFDGTPYSTW